MRVVAWERSAVWRQTPGDTVDWPIRDQLFSFGNDWPVTIISHPAHQGGRSRVFGDDVLAGSRRSGLPGTVLDAWGPVSCRTRVETLPAEWRNGRRWGLKIPCSKGRMGSSPISAIEPILQTAQQTGPQDKTGSLSADKVLGDTVYDR